MYSSRTPGSDFRCGGDSRTPPPKPFCLQAVSQVAVQNGRLHNLTGGGGLCRLRLCPVSLHRRRGMQDRIQTCGPRRPAARRRDW